MTRARSRIFQAVSPFLLLACFGSFWYADTIVDPDLWGHIRFGQDMLQSRSVIQRDIYSYRTAGQRWINHEWLSEVIFASIYNRLGARGLVAFKLLISLLILGLCHAHLTRSGLKSYPCAILLIVMSIPFRMGLGTIRPQIFTLLLFLLELLLLEKVSRTRAGYGLWLLPIFFAFWANLHGGVLAGAGVLGLWISANTADQIRKGARPWPGKLAAIARSGLVVAACALALLINPYHGELVRFLWRAAAVPRPEITEWTPLGLLSLPGHIYLGLLAVGVLGLAGSSRPVRLETSLILGVAATAPLVSNRHYPLFCLALVVLGGEHIAAAWNRWRPPALTGLDRSRFITAMSVVVSLILLAISPARLGCIRVEPFYFAFPARAVALLQQSNIHGNMAVPFDWGEYVLWHLGPELKVSIDGRRETVYSDETYRQSLDFERGSGTWNALLKTAPTDLVLTPNGSPTANLLSCTEGWLALYQDSYCLLFVRSGFPGLTQMLETPVPGLPDNGGGLCFPTRPPAPPQHLTKQPTVHP
jgi:hypothetical protein